MRDDIRAGRDTRTSANLSMTDAPLSTDPAAMPWDRSPSILDAIRSHLDKEGQLDPEIALPDDEPPSDSRCRFGPGVLDGIMSHHSSSSDDRQTIDALVGRVVDYSREPTAANKLAVYRHIAEEAILSKIDPVIAALVGADDVDHRRLYELALSFATDAAEREPVKFGIAILGLFPIDNTDLLQTLGRHNEFTLYAAVALSHREDAERQLWTLARHVDGWGRIHVVERLGETTDPEIQDWLLREGFRNGIMDEYLAAICARAGQLPDALARESVDRDLLDSASQIVQALTRDAGPAESMDDYEDGAIVCRRLIERLAERPRHEQPLRDFVTVDAVRSYARKLPERLVHDSDGVHDGDGVPGWDEAERLQIEQACDRFLDPDIWTDRVGAGLLADDDETFEPAAVAASSLGIDRWPHDFRRLRRNPTNIFAWSIVAHPVTADRLPELLAMAESVFDLDALASGPSDSLGLGPGWETDTAFGFVLQELSRFPGEGAALVRTGLANAVVRNRHQALNAIDRWPEDRWAEVVPWLEVALPREVDDDLRERMRERLQQGPTPADAVPD